MSLTIRKATSNGGTRTDVEKATFSTNEENNIGTTYYEAGIQAGCTEVMLQMMVGSSKAYYDALYKNNSSSSMTIALLVGKD